MHTINTRLLANDPIVSEADAEPAFTLAVRRMANRLFPEGVDVDENAPNTFEAVARHYAMTNRMIVPHSHDECEVFDYPDDYRVFRAWHDWTHLVIGAAFTPEGETAVAYAQVAMLAASEGPKVAAYWAPLIEKLILRFNFGPDFLPQPVGVHRNAS